MYLLVNIFDKLPRHEDSSVGVELEAQLAVGANGRHNNYFMSTMSYTGLLVDCFHLW